jgi:ankyrin repeat protein
MTLLHHLMVNYRDKDEDANNLFKYFVESSQIDLNALTKFGESALDLAVEHRSKALDKAMEPQFRTRFEFNNNQNPTQISLLHRAVFSNNFSALILLLENARAIQLNTMCRNQEGRKPRDYTTQLVFLGKVLRQSEKREVKDQLKYMPT